MAGLTTEQRVRRAAIKLFAAKGFHGTGIRDLAQAAGLSSASLYHYMGTKEELLAELMRESLDRLLTTATTAVSGVDSPVERLGRLVVLHVLTHAAQPNETRVVDHEVRALSASARREVVRLRDDYERLWADAIADGIRAGEFTSPEPSLARLALLEMCNGVARWYSPRGPLGLDELATNYAQMAMRLVGGPEQALPSFEYCRDLVSKTWNRRR
ncbi:TetR/AcrR family transcriptional regulator [Amycolatopsis suaedae]|uniref:TetR/AcrR family transcriptional regulator n=1 Tax=Amycolatopsis suaedae TaxID=2510978 RepID=A0A4Q7JAS9_9PSEU|nr:TetR/AcrR family transcriptional regulator [Amycolatopsis suaedae]RZQ63324.1 TetR/AcrR family transcriptional regulator [Amycolatopsis suaedae]